MLQGKETQAQVGNLPLEKCIATSKSGLASCLTAVMLLFLLNHKYFGLLYILNC